MNRLAVGLALCAAASTASAGEYFRQHWFDYPDPTTAPKVTVRCVQTSSADVPCPTWSNPTRFCRKEACTGHAYDTELLRVAPTFVVSGPDSAEEATKNAVIGFASACAAEGIAAAKGAAAATPSPEPAARVGAGLASGIAYFKVCISTVNTVGIVGGIVKQLEFKVEMPTKWAPL